MNTVTSRLCTTPMLFLSLVVALISCTQAEAPKPESKEESPGEWMYQQRVSPDGTIYPPAVQRAIAQAKSAAAINRSMSAQWQPGGPINTGGRITDVALHPTNQEIIYVATSVGGVWKTLDGGQNWSPMFEEAGRMSIGNIAIAASNPNIIYVGTGEANGSATSGAFFGDGIYRSDDGGNSWSHMGLEQSHHVGRIVIDPDNPDRAFVATTGILYGQSSDRGIFRTTNGGQDWEHVLFVNDSTSAIDVVMSATDTDILFAATWQRRRFSHVRNYGGEGSGIYRSMDGGDTWTLMQNGLPAPDGQRGRIGLAASPSVPGVFYACYTTNAITNVFDGVYRTIDNGESWLRVDTGYDLANAFASFGWFFGNMRVHPQTPDSVYLLGLISYVSGDAGATWLPYAGGNIHVDHHALEIHPLNANFQVAGTDGGVYITHDAGENWTHVKTLPITQFYTSEIDATTGVLRLYGGTQDNGTNRTTTGSTDDWERILGGDGFHVLVDPTDNQFVYAESQWGYLARSIDGGTSFQGALDGIDESARTNWNTPVVFSPADPSVLYYGAEQLYKSIDRAVNWLPMSPDLTNPDPDFLGGANSGTITTIAVAPSDTNVVYVGTDDAYVQVTFDGGANWQVISGDLPNVYVSRIAVDPYDAFTAYVTLSGYRHVDYLPHVLVTRDGGTTWTDISGNLPEAPVNDIIVDPDFEDWLYVGTDLGVWHSFDGGATWEILGEGLPMTIVNDLTLDRTGRRLVAATFGRSMYVYDLSTTTSIDEILPLNDMSVFPNPVIETGFIRFELAKAAVVRCSIVDLQGRTLQIVEHRQFSPGSHQLEWRTRGLNTGLYVVQLQTGKNTTSRRIVVE